MIIDGKKVDYLYIATTKDKYELPIAIADSGKELAKILGISKSSVYQLLSPVNQKNRKYPGVYKVYVGDED